VGASLKGSQGFVPTRNDSLSFVVRASKYWESGAAGTDMSTALRVKDPLSLTIALRDRRREKFASESTEAVRSGRCASMSGPHRIRVRTRGRARGKESPGSTGKWGGSPQGRGLLGGWRDFCCRGAGSAVLFPSGGAVLGGQNLSGRIVELASTTNNCCI